MNDEEPKTGWISPPVDRGDERAERRRVNSMLDYWLRGMVACLATVLLALLTYMALESVAFIGHLIGVGLALAVIPYVIGRIGMAVWRRL